MGCIQFWPLYRFSKCGVQLSDIAMGKLPVVDDCPSVCLDCSDCHTGYLRQRLGTSVPPFLRIPQAFVQYPIVLIRRMAWSSGIGDAACFRIDHGSLSH